MIGLLQIILFYGCISQDKKGSYSEEYAEKKWESKLLKQIKLLGHRNWIVVADAAYPLQSKPGITTIMSNEDHFTTLEKVNKLIQEQNHIKPIIYLDKEIDFISENSAKGITEFRNKLKMKLETKSTRKIIHEDIIAMLDEAAKVFNVVIIKTDFDIPYTSVFFQLDCKYWNAEAENKLREELLKNN